MKLKEFNAENTLSIRADKPSIHINTKTGLFNFNKACCDLVGIASTDRVAFHQDEEEPADWYLEKIKDDRGFCLREKAEVTKGVLFNNTTLAREIVGSVTSTIISGKILVSSTSKIVGKIKLWPLLTVSLKLNQ